MSVALKTKTRAGFLDEWRGIALVCMLFYHTAYDLYAIFGVALPLFTSPFYVNLQRFIGYSFILISGIACCYSHSNLRRGAICFGCGMLMTLGTAVAMPDQLILFGVLHFLGVSMMLFALLRKALEHIPTVWGIAGSLLLFLVTMPLSQGWIGLGPFRLMLPQRLYINPLFPLGFYGAGFSSADYYPLFPWFFLFLAGSFWGRYWKAGKMPEFVYRTDFRALAFVGRHTILIYLVHQPVIYGALLLWFALM